MAHPARTIILTTAVLAFAAPAALAGDPAGASRSCDQLRPFHETAQDETRTIWERCGWRDDELRRPDTPRDMTLAQADEPPAAKINLSMEQRHVIKEIVLKDLKPRKAVDVTLEIGDAVPDGVDVQAFPPECQRRCPRSRPTRSSSPETT